jgi:hypothetical protein
MNKQQPNRKRKADWSDHIRIFIESNIKDKDLSPGSKKDHLINAAQYYVGLFPDTIPAEFQIKSSKVLIHEFDRFAELLSSDLNGIDHVSIAVKSKNYSFKNEFIMAFFKTAIDSANEKEKIGRLSLDAKTRKDLLARIVQPFDRNKLTSYTLKIHQLGFTCRMYLPGTSIRQINILTYNILSVAGYLPIEVSDTDKASFCARHIDQNAIAIKLKA